MLTTLSAILQLGGPGREAGEVCAASSANKGLVCHVSACRLPHTYASLYHTDRPGRGSGDRGVPRSVLRNRNGRVRGRGPAGRPQHRRQPLCCGGRASRRLRRDVCRGARADRRHRRPAGMDNTRAGLGARCVGQSLYVWRAYMCADDGALSLIKSAGN